MLRDSLNIVSKSKVCHNNGKESNRGKTQGSTYDRPRHRNGIGGSLEKRATHPKDKDSVSGKSPRGVIPLEEPPKELEEVFSGA